MSVYSEAFLQNNVANYKLVLIRCHKRKVQFFPKPDPPLVVERTVQRQPQEPSLETEEVQESQGCKSPLPSNIYSNLNYHIAHRCYPPRPHLIAMLPGSKPKH